ncbi:hypothetical protein DFS34DRAFT_640929 [Phlyctochytrium arcticum]|nr:hypothetical protein DFS34DRAFT_640929 [Phlyctochytrium arcticum]
MQQPHLCRVDWLQSVYDTRQTALDTTIATKVNQSAYDTRQSAIDTALSNKQGIIKDLLIISGVDNISSTLLNENYVTTSPTGTLAGNAVYITNSPIGDATKYIRLQDNNQTYSNGSVTYSIPASRYWTLNADVYMSSFRADEGIQLANQGWIAVFSGYFKYTRLYAPDGSFKEVSPSPFPRDVWVNVRMKTVYDTCQLYINNFLVTTHTNSTSNIPTSTTCGAYGFSGGFGTAKYIRFFSLVQDSNGTEAIKFTPYNGKISSQISVADDGNYGSSLIFSSSTGSSGTLQEQVKIASSGVTLSNTTDSTSSITGGTVIRGGLGIAKKLYIAAIPLSNYTLLSTYNARQTVIDNKFTPIETRLSQLKALSNNDVIDLGQDVTGVLPIAKVDTTTLQPLITSANAASIRTTLGLSSTATSGMIDYANVTDAIGNLDFSRLSNVPSYVSQAVYYDRINQLGSLANKNVIDLASSDVANILPSSKVDLSSRQPLDATLTALSSATPSIPKSLTLTSPTSGSNNPNLSLLGGGGNFNSVSIQMTPWSARPGGISTKIASIDDNVGGARLSFQAASGGDSVPLTEFMSGTSSSVIIPITMDSTSSTSGALQGFYV